MKRIFFSLTLFLLAANASAALLPEVPKVTACGRVFVGNDLTNLKILYARTDTANSRAHFRIANGTAGENLVAYRVPSGNTLALKCIKWINETAAASSQAVLALTGGQDLGIGGSNTAFTAPLYLGGSSSNGLGVSAATLGAEMSKDIDFTALGSSTIGVDDGSGSGSGYYILYGILQ